MRRDLEAYQELVQRRLGELGIDAALIGRGQGFGLGCMRTYNQGSYQSQ